jgi:putative protein-disulfide isomerase
MKPTLYYCYDAWCGWCYGFSPVIRRLFHQYKNYIDFETLSGGMILAEKPAPVGIMAPYVAQAYQQVEDYTGVTFGKDYLWHIFNPELSDWYPDSLKAAVAMCVFKSYLPHRTIEFAADLQYALHHEGRDLTDNEAYRHLLEAYGIPAEDFYHKLASNEYEEAARYEFALVKQLKVKGYPAVLLQVSDSKFFLISSGFATYEQVAATLNNVLEETAKQYEQPVPVA